MRREAFASCLNLFRTASTVGSLFICICSGKIVSHHLRNLIKADQQKKTMKRLLVAAAILFGVVLLLSVASHGALATEGLFNGDLQGPPILDLTDADFESVTQASTGMTSMPSVMVFFKTEWCNFCTSVKPEVTKFASLYSAHATRLVRVDCDASTSTCRRFGVKGYPTMVLLKSGKMYRYNAARTANSMTGFAQSPNVDAEEVPRELMLSDNIAWWLQIIVDDFQRLYESNPNLLTGMVGVIFIVFLCILVLAVSEPRAAPRSAAAPRASAKQQAAAGAASKAPAAKPAAKAAASETAKNK